MTKFSHTKLYLHHKLLYRTQENKKKTGKIKNESFKYYYTVEMSLYYTYNI